MELVQNGYSCDFELNIFIKMFFRRDDVGTITTDFNFDGGSVEVKTKIEYENKVFTGECSAELEKDFDAAMHKKICTTTCAKSFCRAACKIKNVRLPWGVMSGIRPAKNIRCLTDEGRDEKQTREFVKKVYEVSDEKLDLAFEVARNERKILSDNPENSISVYIGIPFCPTRCAYCSFVSTDIRVSGRYMADFVRLLCREIEKTAETMSKMGVYIENIYIGGGTPTTLSSRQLDEIFTAINKYWDLSHLKEFTLEAGRPDTITLEKLEAAKKGGVNRISINPQTMNGETLEKVGRTHSPQDVFTAFALARKAGFDNINMDLIAGLPDETPEMFKYSVDELIKLDPENITVHTMCIKRAARLDTDSSEVVHSNTVTDMLDYAAKRMKETGRIPYYMYRQKNILGNLENVGYAKEGCMSIYNVKIMEEVQTILALGGGGTSKLVMGDRIERVFNFKNPDEYIRRFDEILKRKDEILKIMHCE